MASAVLPSSKKVIPTWGVSGTLRIPLPRDVGSALVALPPHERLASAGCSPDTVGWAAVQPRGHGPFQDRGSSDAPLLCPSDLWLTSWLLVRPSEHHEGRGFPGDRAS